MIARRAGHPIVLLARRARKLGRFAVTGQALFAAIITPLLRSAAEQRIEPSSASSRWMARCSIVRFTTSSR